MAEIKRTTYCGLVTEKLVDQQVSLAGWVQKRRDHGGLIFIDLRDKVKHLASGRLSEGPARYVRSKAPDKCLLRYCVWTLHIACAF